jgi:hypothetical protein
MRRRTVRLNVKLFDSTRYRRGQRVLVMAIHEDGSNGVVEGVITGEYGLRAPFDNGFRKVYAVRVERDLQPSEVGLFSLKDLNYGDAV